MATNCSSTNAPSTLDSTVSHVVSGCALRPVAPAVPDAPVPPVPPVPPDAPVEPVAPVVPVAPLPAAPVAPVVPVAPAAPPPAKSVYRSHWNGCGAHQYGPLRHTAHTHANTRTGAVHLKIWPRLAQYSSEPRLAALQSRLLVDTDGSGRTHVLEEKMDKPAAPEGPAAPVAPVVPVVPVEPLTSVS